MGARHEISPEVAGTDVTPLSLSAVRLMRHSSDPEFRVQLHCIDV